jgi:hypothetical protein
LSVKLQSIRPQFVESMPKPLEHGILYVSDRFKTASHRCCCGCGTRIVTPLGRTEYTLTKRGELVSLHPSIGNWDHPCQSHYWIRDNRVIWAAPMSRAEIARGRTCDDALKAAYFGKVSWWQRATGAMKAWLDRWFRS